MRPSYLTHAVLATLLFGFATAYAQTTTPAAVSPAKAASTTPDTTGNDLLDGAKPSLADRLATPESPGYSKAAGNDLVNGDNMSDQETGTHPAWNTLDMRKHGYLTASDLKSHKWLTQNFSRCNSNHDGHLTQKQYDICTK